MAERKLEYELILYRVRAYIRIALNKKFSNNIDFDSIYKDESRARESLIGLSDNDRNKITVTEIELYEDQEGYIYSIKGLGMFADVKDDRRDNMIDSIREKLSPEELELITFKS